MDQLISEREAANLLGMSLSWMRQLRWRGEGPPHSRLGNRTKYAMADLEAWVREQACN